MQRSTKPLHGVERKNTRRRSHLSTLPMNCKVNFWTRNNKLMISMSEGASASQDTGSRTRRKISCISCLAGETRSDPALIEGLLTKSGIVREMKKRRMMNMWNYGKLE